MNDLRNAFGSIFSEENVRSYAAACVEIHDHLEALERAGYTSLVNPSRGATPFIEALPYVHVAYRRTSDEDMQSRRLLITPFLGKEILLPFTADPPPDAPSVDGMSPSEQIRDYWVRVLKAVLHGSLVSPELQFYQNVTLRLLGFEPNLGLPGKPPGDKFVFLDTAVSGQAVCEIERSFVRHGLADYHLLIVLDRDGGRLKPEYASHIYALRDARRATIIKVRELFTEDRGPALTGVWCVSVPQLMQQGHRALGLRQPALIGAAAGFVRISADGVLQNLPFTRSYAQLMFMLHAVITSGSVDVTSDLLSHSREKLIERLSAGSSNGLSPLSRATTEAIARNAIRENVSLARGRKAIAKKVTHVEVSSSHVIRAHFEPVAVNDALRWLR